MTVNYQSWIPGIDVPYVVALIAIAEQEDIRLMSDMCDCDPDRIKIGTPVEVYFIEKNGIYLPLFRPTQD